MNTKRVVMIGLGAVSLVAVGAMLLMRPGTTPGLARESNQTLVDAVRSATAQYKDVGAATNAGYGLFHGCVSGPAEGAMGVHYVNGNFVDGVADAAHPEALLYEPQGGRLRLTGVEYVVIASAWDAAHPGGEPPVLNGQMFQFVTTPNRYRLPAFYELHVWAWKHNAKGTFADFNPSVECDDFTGG